MNEDDKALKLIVDEYKMSMGGSFFNKTPEKNSNLELERLIMENGMDNHLFDTHKLLSVYDELSESNKREFFRRVVVAFIKFKFNENIGE